MARQTGIQHVMACPTDDRQATAVIKKDAGDIALQQSKFILKEISGLT
jgi:hypothetical protein